MGALFKNTEVKNFSIHFLLVSITLIVLLTTFLRANIQSINEALIKQNIGAIGALVKEYPELEGQLVQNYIKGYQHNYEYGKEILEKYSYNEKMSPYKNNMFSNLYSNYLNGCGASVLILIILLYIISLFNFHTVFIKIREFQDAAQKIVEGDFSYNFADNKEGDIYILGHQFNQMSMRLEGNLQQLKKERNRLKDIISDITHQLKTPLASLIMFNELMVQDIDMDKEERMQFLNMSKNQLDRIEWLIKNLLKMARFEAGAVILNRISAPIYNTITASLEGIHTAARLKGIQIKIHDTQKALVVHDTDWTAEALSNIIKNSVEHSKQNGEIDIFYEETPLSVQITISDHGEGIKKTELAKIFHRFYKGQNSTNPMSIGIGLYIAKTIVEAQNGSISVESKEGIGTKFMITFLKTVI